MTDKLVLFDMYGVLMHLPQGERDAELIQSALGDNHDISPQEFRRAWDKYRGPVDAGLMSSAEFWAHLEDELGTKLNGPKYEETEMAMVSSWDPQMVAFFESLQTEPGLKVAILSNIPASIAEVVYTKMNWYEAAPYKFLSYQMHLAKPDPEIYKQATAQMGISEANSLMIDDKEENCQGARAAGLAAICHHDLESTKKLVYDFMQKN